MTTKQAKDFIDIVRGITSSTGTKSDDFYDDVVIRLLEGLIPESSSSSPSIPYTYDELEVIKEASELVKGQKYTLTDFATKHIIPNTEDENVGVEEPIILIANSENSFYNEVVSTLYPQDLIRYEFVDSTTAGGDKGRIYYRKDVIINVSTGYDWRNVKFRRWYSQNIGYSSSVGTFKINELVTGGTSGATARLIGDTGSLLSFKMIVGSFQLDEQLTGSNSEATTNINEIFITGIHDNVFNNETATPIDIYTFGNSPIAGNCNNTEIGEISDYGILNYQLPDNKLNNITISVSSYSKIGTDSANSTINNLFNTKIESNFKNNIIEYSEDLFIGASFTSNIATGEMGVSLIGAHVSGNLILDGFQVNKLQDYSQDNFINFGFQRNTGNGRILRCITPEDFRLNEINTDIIDIDFSGATLVSGGYNKKIIMNNANVVKLIYLDGITGLDVVNDITD